MKEIVCYTVDEVAEMLKLSREAIYDHIKRGKIKAVKIGNKYRITAEEIDRILHPAE